MTDQNADLVRLHAALIALVNQLSAAQEAATSVDAVVALGREIAEVNHRVAIVGQLVFHAATDRIATAVAAVDDGRAAVDAAIADIGRINDFLRAISKFLALVDKAIDTAKLI